MIQSVYTKGIGPSEACLLNSEGEKKWYALYTKGRHEKLADRELSKKGFETFLPVRKVRRQWSDRVQTIEDPLFRSYLFVYTPFSNRALILNTAGIVKFVGFSGQDPIEVSSAEILNLKRFVASDLEIDPFPFLKKGARVCVRTGPLKGIEGYIVRKDKHCRLVISLDLLMQSVSVELDEACVEAIQ